MISPSKNKTQRVVSPKKKKSQIEEFVIVEDDNKVNKNRFLNCCTRVKDNDDIKNNMENINKLKSMKLKEKEEEDRKRFEEKQKESNEVNRKAKEGCNDCSVGCSKICNCCCYHTKSTWDNFIECIKNCFGCNDKKDKKK